MPVTNSKAFRREIATLADSKGRRRLGAFMAEGTKCVLDTLDHFNLRYLIATPRWIEDNPMPSVDESKIVTANRGEIGEISSFILAPDVIAVYDLPADIPFSAELTKDRLVLALDRIQDPGHLGTIMRTADWMGITTILASKDTVDCFNPKAVQASMGAISRVHVIYGDISKMLSEMPSDYSVYGTFLDGENIYSARLSDNGIIVMGNEGRGISDELARCINRRLLIPSYPPERPTSESLNVAAATAIVLSLFRSRKHS